MAELRGINEELVVQRDEKDKEIDALNLKIVELESHGFEQLEAHLHHALEHIAEVYTDVCYLNIVKETIKKTACKFMRDGSG